jgi:hypothetical protein
MKKRRGEEEEEDESEEGGGRGGDRDEGTGRERRFGGIWYQRPEVDITLQRKMHPF